MPELAKMEKVVGFDEYNDHAESQPKKKKKLSLTKKPGGFQSMGLSFPILKAIQKRGYNVPTPIQRKTIPLVMEGRDVVAMARTGSGKTAAFLIPMFERLKCRGTQSGIRAIILSPTRELALQTMRFVKELGKFTGLRHVVIVGGDPMESQFSSLHNNPDIVIGTPGRLLHICVEMELKLNNIEVVIFDEADRLFEMGFGEQLHEIIERLPQSRQTLLFSATLPKVLVEFAKAGLSDPVLIRLDVESKLPETLNVSFVSSRSDEKPAALLCLLKYVVKKRSQCIIFAATKHHVEYIHMLLNCAKISNTYVYSDLDQAARKINTAKFQNGIVCALIVTDIAARGIDIPQLDYVINYNFPAKPKLFVHRVGRCARAGREGWAISLVAPDELCYMLDIHLFLGRPLSFVQPAEVSSDFRMLGCIPPSLIETQLSQILQWQESSSDLVSLKKVSDNGYKHYLKCRPGASRESVRRGKEMNLTKLGISALFAKCPSVSNSKDEAERAMLIAGIHTYRPPGNIFEIGQSSRSELYAVMKKKREAHKTQIFNHKRKEEEKAKENEAKDISSVTPNLEMCSNDDMIGSTFSKVICTKRKSSSLGNDEIKRRNIDKENYIPYKPADYHTEEGLAVSNFQRDASAAGFDMNADTDSGLKSSSAKKVWDKKKKKMVAVEVKRKVRSESGTWIDASYKSGRYKNWVEKNKIDSAPTEQEDVDNNAPTLSLASKNLHSTWANHNRKIVDKKRKSELKKPEQILKARILMEKKRKKFGKKKRKKK